MKAKSVGAFEAKTHFSALLNEVEEGAIIYITRHGRPIAELRPVAPAKRPCFGAARGKGFRLGQDFDASLDGFDEYTK